MTPEHTPEQAPAEVQLGPLLPKHLREETEHTIWLRCIVWDAGNQANAEDLMLQYLEDAPIEVHIEHPQGEST